MAEIIIAINEVGEDIQVSAIIEDARTDSRLVKDITQIVAPAMLVTASREISKLFQYLNEENHE